MTDGIAGGGRTMSSDATHDSARTAPSRRAAQSHVDLAQLGAFRASLLGQLIAAGFFGLVPLVAPVDFARAFGLSGDEPYLYRLAGAATIGYVAPALIGLWRGSWASLRIPIATTFLFNATAAAVSLVTIDEVGLQPLAVIVALAASAFAAISAYWLWRGGWPDDADGKALEPGFRLSLSVATVAATIVGGSQLLLPRAFADFFDVSATDLVIIRLAGAATLGFALAGLLSAVVNRWPAIRTQTIASIVANVAATIASVVYLAQGGTSWLGILLLVAAGGLVLSLSAWSVRAGR
jgi:hypothetical protein